MNRYENITIIDADVGEDDKKALLERIESQITKRNGTLLAFDDWGMRKLAYEIRKKKQGQYVRTDFCGTGEIVDAIEQMLRHDQRVLRFMTVRMEENVDPAALQAGAAEEAGEQEAVAEKTEPETAVAETEAPADQTEESAPASQEEES